MRSSLLERPAGLEPERLKSSQIQLDSSLELVRREAANFENIAAMSVGSAVFRVLRAGSLGLAAGKMSQGLNALSYAAALSGEVSAYRGATSFLEYCHGRNSGEAVFDKQGWIRSFGDFLALKAAGALSQGGNALLRHSAQASAMVGSRQLHAQVGLLPKPSASLLEQFIEAESMNLALGAGHSLFALAGGGRIQTWETGLELGIRVMAEPSQAAAQPITILKPALPRLASDRTRTGSSDASMGPESTAGNRSKPADPGFLRRLSELASAVVDRGAVREQILGTYTDLTGRLQAELLEAIRRIDEGDKVNPTVMRLLLDPRIRAAGFLPDSIRAELDAKLQSLYPPSNPSAMPIHPAGFRAAPSVSTFRRMVVETQTPAPQLARVLNALFFPRIDLSRYAHHGNEGLIYIAGPEDASKLESYLGTDTLTFGEMIFFARRNLRRNWSVSEAVKRMNMEVERLDSLEKNEGEASNEEIAEFERLYGLDGKKLTEARHHTRAYVSSLPVSTPLPPSPTPSQPPATDWLHLVSGSAEHNLDQAHRSLQVLVAEANQGSSRVLSAENLISSLAGLAVFFQRALLRTTNELHTDFLTGISNRRALDSLKPNLENSLLYPPRSQDPNRPHETWVLSLDADYFKRVNDTYGHHNGDVVLRHLASIFSNSIRKTGDHVFRIGGEEFVIILTDTSAEGARRVFHTIQHALSVTPVEMQLSEDQATPGARVILYPTVSVGAAKLKMVPEGEGDSKTHHGAVQHAIDRSDKALYEAKHSGRNRISISED